MPDRDQEGLAAMLGVPSALCMALAKVDSKSLLSTIHPRNGLHFAASDASLLSAPGDVAPLERWPFEDAAIVGGDA